uniref:Nucleolar protein 11-like n=1 Tax=Phallusia mammillata TaxID=59560 RepID=A0A6F9DN40_9ASCI|nr:nucleolar protein 11-like [Phallusia mammillata]
MASFGSKVTLLQKTLNRQFVGISLDKREDNVIVTFENNVTIYDTYNKRVVQSWSVSRGQKITSPTIYNKDDDEYAFVVNGKVIHTNSEDNFDKLEKFTVNCPIHSILPDCNNESLVVFTNGQVVLLSKVFENPKFEPQPNSHISEQDQIIDCQAFVVNNQSLIMLLCKSAGKHFLVIYNTNTEENMKLSVEYSSCQLCSACFHSTTNQTIVFVSLWDNGMIFKSIITSQTLQTKTFDYTKVANVALLQDTSFSLLTQLSEDLIAVVCQENEKTCIAIYDLQFGLCHHKIFNVSQNLQIQALRDQVVLIENGGISSIPFKTNPVNLMSAYKKENENSIKLNQVSWSTNTSKVLETKKSTEKHMSILISSLDASQLVKSWKAVWKSQSESQRQVFVLSPIVSQLLIRITDDNLWLSELIEIILSTGLVSSSICPQLIQKVLKHEDLSLLSICLKQLQNISETDLVLCLDFFIKSEKLQTKARNNEEDEFLETILSLPYNESNMRDAVGALSLTQIVVFLEALNVRLGKCSLKSDKLVVSWDQIISWICLLLDAHFTQIVVSPESWEVLVKLQETVNTQVEIFQEIYEINILLTKLQESFRRSRKPNRFTYRIEQWTI